jgi:hypothetical protein
MRAAAKEPSAMGADATVPAATGAADAGEAAT